VPPLRKNVLRQFGAAEKLSAWLASHAESVVKTTRRRHHHPWVNEVLSDQHHGGFYASQDADYSLDDDGDYFTWTLQELRAALLPDEARVMELYYDVQAHGEMHHNPAKNVLWVARGAARHRGTSGIRRIRGAPDDCPRQRKNAGGAFASPHALRGQDALRQLERHVCLGVSRIRPRLAGFAGLELPQVRAKNYGPHASRSVVRRKRICPSHRWSAARRIARRSGFGVLALLDGYEATLNEKYFRAALRTMDMAIENMATANAADFSIALRTRRPWAGWKSAANHFRIRPLREQTQSRQPP